MCHFALISVESFGARTLLGTIIQLFIPAYVHLILVARNVVYYDL